MYNIMLNYADVCATYYKTVRFYFYKKFTYFKESN